MRSNVNMLPGFLRLAGLKEDAVYMLKGEEYYGDELMNLGVPVGKLSSDGLAVGRDFASYVEVLEAK
jgi:alpha-galactosidase